MKNGFALALAFVALLGFSASTALARGGHGGGHHGGGHHSGHHGGHHGSHHSSHHHSGHHAHHNHNHHHHTHFHHNNRPFTHGWYANHGGAWGNGWGWPTGYNGWWAGAGFGAAATWLGLNAATTPAAYAYPAGATTVYTADTQNGQPTTAQNGQPAANALTDTDLAQATKLAKSGATDPPKGEQFLPLGVFSLAPQDQKEASAMLQLAVTKDGVLRGTYYDLLTDKEQPVQGAIDKATQRVAFTAGPNGKTVFETSLNSLTQDVGPMALYFENGAARPWTVARFDDESEVDSPDAEPEKPATDKTPAKKVG